VGLRLVVLGALREVLGAARRPGVRD
jgi:hypothetical protein